MLRFDGSCSSSHRAGANFVIENHNGEPYVCQKRLSDKVMWNQAKYAALVAELELAHKLGITKLRVLADFKLVCSQIPGE